MINKNPLKGQMNFFQPILKEQLNPRHELYLLSDTIDWSSLESDLSQYYINFGRPAKPIRLMVSLLILKQLYNLSDESVVARWTENPYFQYFSGFEHFQWEFPCNPSDLVHFRNRIGKEGIERIFRMSVELQGKDGKQDKLCIDTTVQEKNITYPTDTKLQVRIIDKCRKLANVYHLKLRQSYTRTVKSCLLLQRFRNHPRNRKKAMAAARKIKTIAWRLVRELERLLPAGIVQDQLALFKQVLSQKKKDKNKIYSLHEPEVSCIAKGKEHKPYEFGSKVSFGITRTTNVIVSVATFKGNPYDGDTLEETLQVHKRITGIQAKEASVDRGYRGRKEIEGVQIITPKPLPAGATDYQKRKMRMRFRRRAAIEPIFGHTKKDYRMERNYLKGFVGDIKNALLAAMAFNIRRWIRKILLLCLQTIEWIIFEIKNTENRKTSFSFQYYKF
jgi:Transposase DDE domain./Transposase domain (DUF772).